MNTNDQSCMKCGSTFLVEDYTLILGTRTVSVLGNKKTTAFSPTGTKSILLCENCVDRKRRSYDSLRYLLVALFVILGAFIFGQAGKGPADSGFIMIICGAMFFLMVAFFNLLPFTIQKTEAGERLAADLLRPSLKSQGVAYITATQAANKDPGNPGSWS